MYRHGKLQLESILESLHYQLHSLVKVWIEAFWLQVPFPHLSSFFSTELHYCLFTIHAFLPLNIAPVSHTKGIYALSVSVSGLGAAWPDKMRHSCHMCSWTCRSRELDLFLFKCHTHSLWLPPCSVSLLAGLPTPDRWWEDTGLILWCMASGTWKPPKITTWYFQLKYAV